MDIVVDESGASYVTGYTYSIDFPTTPGGFDTTLAGVTDLFVVKLNPAGSALIYATFIGGSSEEVAGEGWRYRGAIAVDGSGSAYITGNTRSSDFPTTPGAYDRSFGGDICGTPPLTYPCGDAFVTKLNSTGSALDYSTFLGGADDDAAFGIEVDQSGVAYVAGRTSSSDFPSTPSSFQTTYNGNEDAFVVKINATGSGLGSLLFSEAVPMMKQAL